MRVTGLCEHAYRSRILTVQMTGHVTVLHAYDMAVYPNHPENLRQWTRIMETIMAVRQEIQALRALIERFSGQVTGKKYQASAMPWPTPNKPNSTKPKPPHKANFEED